MTRREAAEVNDSGWRARHPRATLIRRFSGVWLCAACLVLTCVGASDAKAQSGDAHQATEPVCCFKLSIWDEESVGGSYSDPSQTGQNPVGDYGYDLRGTAYGLAVLEPPHSGSRIFCQLTGASLPRQRTRPTTLCLMAIGRSAAR
jgi:hypothetical protein